MILRGLKNRNITIFWKCRQPFECLRFYLTLKDGENPGVCTLRFLDARHGRSSHSRPSWRLLLKILVDSQPRFCFCCFLFICSLPRCLAVLNGVTEVYVTFVKPFGSCWNDNIIPRGSDAATAFVQTSWLSWGTLLLLLFHFVCIYNDVIAITLPSSCFTHFTNPSAHVLLKLNFSLGLNVPQTPFSLDKYSVISSIHDTINLYSPRQVEALPKHYKSISVPFMKVAWASSEQEVDACL